MKKNIISNQALVIFGASGDLTHRKLIPAIYHLFRQKLLPPHFFILGVGRTDMSDADFRSRMKDGILQFGAVDGMSLDNKTIDEFSNCLYYISINTEDEKDYEKLKERLDELDSSCKTDGNFIFYLSTPPKLYTIISDSLASVNLNLQSENKFRRLIIEKPFGTDYESAKNLNADLLKNYTEDQLYRIDHYLGKETVQNIFVTRFANGIYEPLWNRNYIQKVEITSAESIGVGSRGGYYENAGALRDMVQNHILQLVALIAQEPPITLNSEDIRNEKMKVFQAFRPLTKDFIKSNVIRGQYTASSVRGEKRIGYREEKGVSPESRTETYFAMKLFIDNWRWKDVPFYLRSGKCLPTRVTEIVIYFKPAPLNVFGSQNSDIVDSGNQLVIRIQPDEGLLLKTIMKIPGAGYEIKSVNLDFHYTQLKETYVPEAYERLLLDAMMGDSTLYIRQDALMETWKFVQPILDYFKEENTPLYGYPAGSWGPDTADDLMAAGESWRYPCKNLSDDGIYCEL